MNNWQIKRIVKSSQNEQSAIGAEYRRIDYNKIANPVRGLCNSIIAKSRETIPHKAMLFRLKKRKVVGLPIIFPPPESVTMGTSRNLCIFLNGKIGVWKEGFSSFEPKIIEVFSLKDIKKGKNINLSTEAYIKKMFDNFGLIASHYNIK